MGDLGGTAAGSSPAYGDPSMLALVAVDDGDHPGVAAGLEVDGGGVAAATAERESANSEPAMAMKTRVMG